MRFSAGAKRFLDSGQTIPFLSGDSRVKAALEKGVEKAGLRHIPDTDNAASIERFVRDPSIRQSVQTQQMRTIYESTSVATIAATVFAFALAYRMSESVSFDLVRTWLAAKCVIAAARIVQGFMFGRRKSDSLRWLRWGTVLLFIDGLVWGSAGLWLMPVHDIAGMTVLSATLCGVATIATFVIHTDWLACLAYTTPILVQPVIYMVSRGDSFGIYGGFSIGTFLCLLLVVARRAERHVVELLTLRFANKRLNDDLSAALEKVTRESKTKDIFVTNMSHELRTPLHGILGLARTLHAQASPPDRAVLRLIRRSGEHLLMLINNVLEFSRFEAHGIDIHPVHSDLSRTVSEAVGMCAPAAADKYINITMDLRLTADGQNPYATTDPFRIRQVVLNLVGNAIKFTGKGGIVTVSAEWPDDTEVVLRVSDNGIGMTPDAILSLFQPFRQVDTSRTRRHGGTGLGLNITQAICHKLGGDITCTSEIGRGSVFEVRLPLERTRFEDFENASTIRQDSAYADLGQDSALTIPPPPTEVGRKPLVLLVEDNEVNALVAQFSLEKLGISSATATNGAEAVASFRDDRPRPDLILMDCQMPVMDGYEATRRIRQVEREQGLAPTPIIALTANVCQSDRDDSRSAGMTAFLPKPFSEEQLKDALEYFSMVPGKSKPSRSKADYATLLL